MSLDDAGRDLRTAARAEVGGWLRRSVDRVVVDVPDETELEQAIERSVDEVDRSLAALVDADIDEQSTTPLSILRDATRPVSELLRSWGVDPPERERWRREHFPDDRYDLVPAAFADVGPRVNDAGLRWGAAKALAHRRRHGG